MTTGMKLLVIVWLFIIARFMGTLLAARHCLRIRTESKTKASYETFTGLGIGMGLWGIADFFSVWNGIVNVSPQIVAMYPPQYFVIAVILESSKTIGIWTIALVLMNGGAPGKLRQSIFWVLRKIHLMDSRPILPPTQLDRIENHAIKVANDLRESQVRADSVRPGNFGEAADAASGSDKPKNNVEKTDAGSQ